MTIGRPARRISNRSGIVTGRRSAGSAGRVDIGCSSAALGLILPDLPSFDPALVGRCPRWTCAHWTCPACTPPAEYGPSLTPTFDSPLLPPPAAPDSAAVIHCTPEPAAP